MIVREDELKHYGILGMKWGVRRYVNQDGTLTPAGKQRYYKNEKTMADAPRKAVKKATVSGVSGVTSAAALSTGVKTLPLSVKASIATAKGAAYVASKGGALIGGNAAINGSIIAGQTAVNNMLLAMGSMNPALLAIGVGASAVGAASAIGAARAVSKSSKAKRQNKNIDAYRKVATN